MPNAMERSLRRLLIIFLLLVMAALTVAIGLIWRMTGTNLSGSVSDVIGTLVIYGLPIGFVGYFVLARLNEIQRETPGRIPPIVTVVALEGCFALATWFVIW